MGSTWETQRSLTPAMKIIGVLLLFMFTRAATAVTCATGTAVNCNACLYRFSEAGHMDIDTDNSPSSDLPIHQPHQHLPQRQCTDLQEDCRPSETLFLPRVRGTRTRPILTSHW